MRDKLITNIMKAKSPAISLATAEYLADHLLAEGVIVPKFKVGEKLYYISASNKIVENKVYYVGEYAKALCYMTDGKPLLDNTFFNKDANVDWYFTREEAEKSLAERREQ